MCSKTAWQWCLTAALLLNETESRNFTPMSSAEAEKYLHNQGKHLVPEKKSFQLLISKKLKASSVFCKTLLK